ncbi:MAG: response regulator [Anaerolineae bacterium]|nr:response regulator [Anaerolineae bacterium]
MTEILVVEDSPTIISTVEQFLQMQGYGVHVARDGLSALAAVRALAPKLVLLDIMLPKVDGFEVLNVIRNNPNYDQMPIIMMSALTNPEDVERAYSVGADDYIKKPFTETDLLDVVKQHFINGRKVQAI